jgi:hypothetical protein
LRLSLFDRKEMVSMKVQFRSFDPQAQGLRLHAVERVRGALRRLRGFVARVKVNLADANGPLPGVDKRCELQAELPGGQVARIAATARTWGDAVELATARLREQVVGRLRHALVAEPRVLAPARLQAAWRGTRPRAQP